MPQRIAPHSPLPARHYHSKRGPEPKHDSVPVVQKREAEEPRGSVSLYQADGVYECLQREEVVVELQSYGRLVSVSRRVALCCLVGCWVAAAEAGDEDIETFLRS